MDTPTDVDFRIMDTFLHFYTTLGGFVNCRLYAMLNLRYPPKVDVQRAKDDAGISALMLESKDESTAIEDGAAAAAAPSAKKAKKSKKLKAAAAKRAASAVKAVGSAELDGEEEDSADESDEDSADESGDGSDAPESGEDEAPAKGKGKGKALDEFPDQIAGGDATVADSEATKRAAAEAAQFEGLFSGCWFYLNREVPRQSLEFVIRSFGGHVSWQGLGGDDEVGSGPYKEGDSRVTHHIVDRPKLTGLLRPERHYVQPQWVYDAINARKLLPTAAYTIGAALPPHLSPFEVEDADGYTPPEAAAIAATAADVGGVDAAGSSFLSAGGVDDLDNENEEDTYRQELEAEAKGLPIDDKAVEKKKKKKKEAKAKRVEESAGEHKELAKSLMSKKNKKLYEQIMYGKAKKAAAGEKLTAKRKAHDDGVTKAKKKRTAK
jgi:pescadillo protein